MPSAKVRSNLRLDAEVSVAPAEVLALIKRAAETAKAPPLDVGKRLEVEGSDQHGITFAVTDIGSVVNVAMRKRRPLCMFTAEARENGGRTRVRVGGLERYSTRQQSVMFIPMAPKTIPGFQLYKTFLDAVSAELRKADANASVNIQMPTR